jgi:hypothetical protein
VTPRWTVAPYFLVDVVEDCNGYRIGFGHDTEG